MLPDVHMNELEQLMEQGKAFIRQKKQQKALLHFNSAVLLAPEQIEALVLCAETLMNLSRSAEAAVYSQRALQLCSNPNILTLHGKILYQMGEYNKALYCFESIIAEEPSNYIALCQRALCLTQVNRYDEALEVYQQALAYSKNQDAWVFYNYSLCLLAKGNLLAGFRAFEYRWKSLLLAKSRVWVLPEFANIAATVIN